MALKLQVFGVYVAPQALARPLRWVRPAPDREATPERAIEFTVLVPLAGDSAARVRRQRAKPDLAAWHNDARAAHVVTWRGRRGYRRPPQHRDPLCAACAGRSLPVTFPTCGRALCQAGQSESGGL